MRSGVNRRNFLRFSAMAAAAPIFDVKLPRGLDFTLQNSPTPEKYLIETMPGGVAVVIVVEQGHTPGHGLDEVFFGSGRILQCEVQPAGEFQIKNRSGGSHS